MRMVVPAGQMIVAISPAEQAIVIVDETLHARSEGKSRILTVEVGENRKQKIGSISIQFGFLTRNRNFLLYWKCLIILWKIGNFRCVRILDISKIGNSRDFLIFLIILNI